MGSDTTLIEIKKNYLKQYFVSKDIRWLRYFFGIEIVYHKCWLLLSQKKNALNRLEETSLLKYKPITTSIESNLVEWSKDSILYDDVKQCRRMIGELIYLTVMSLKFPLLWDYWVNSRINQRTFIGRLLCEFWYMLRALLEKSYSIRNMKIFTSQSLKMLDTWRQM